jgi:hypothetical protein
MTPALADALCAALALDEAVMAMVWAAAEGLDEAITAGTGR